MRGISSLVLKAAGIFVGILFLLSCSKQNNPVVCTMEFRAIQIKVIGEELHEAYTVRLVTGDTLYFDHQAVVTGENHYTVLDDSYQSQLQGKTEQFRFEGIVNGEVVVSEVFILSADLCHVNYVSGNLEVEFE